MKDEALSNDGTRIIDIPVPSKLRRKEILVDKINRLIQICQKKRNVVEMLIDWFRSEHEVEKSHDNHSH